MVKDETPLNTNRCFLTNNRHPWDSELADFVSEIEDNRDGRLGCKEDEELFASHLAHHRISLTEAQVQDAYMHRIHLYRFRIIPDGNCLFRAVSQALFGTQSLHTHVREMCIEHLAQNVVEFLPFFEPPSQDDDLLDFAFLQITKLRENCVWGGFESLMGLSDMYNIEFHVILGGAVKNSCVTIHKYYFNRDSGGQGPDGVHTVQQHHSGLPMKKVFLIWLSCGHYDLAVDTMEEPVETDTWLKNMEAAAASSADPSASTSDEAARPRRRKSSSSSAGPVSRRRSSGASGQSNPVPGATNVVEEMPLLAAAIQGQPHEHNRRCQRRHGQSDEQMQPGSETLDRATSENQPAFHASASYENVELLVLNTPLNPDPGAGDGPAVPDEPKP